MFVDPTRPCPACGKPVRLVEDRLRVPFLQRDGELGERDEFRCRACQRSFTAHLDPVALGVLASLLAGLLAAVLLAGFNRAAAVAIGLALVVVGARWLRCLRSTDAPD